MDECDDDDDDILEGWEELEVVERIELEDELDEGEGEDEEEEEEEDEEVVDSVDVIDEPLLISCELVEENLWELLIVDLLLLLDENGRVEVEVKVDGEDIDVEIDELVDDIDDEVKELCEENVFDEILDCCSDKLLEEWIGIISVFDEVVVVLHVGDSLELVDTEKELCCPVCSVWLLCILLLIYWAEVHDTNSRCTKNSLFIKIINWY